MGKGKPGGPGKERPGGPKSPSKPPPNTGPNEEGSKPPSTS